MQLIPQNLHLTYPGIFRPNVFRNNGFSNVKSVDGANEAHRQEDCGLLSSALP